MALQPLRPEDPHHIGSYRLLGRLGGGGMGQVFLGRSPGGRPVAVKLVLPGLAADAGFRRRFTQEIEAARRVGGFHTAQVVDADPAADPPWLVTAYVPGPSLQEAVEAHGPLPQRTVQALGAGLAEGLAAVHACGLVHRDLKPGNVILAADGPRIIDFGIARALDSATATATGSVIGTPGFMSPEQAEGDRNLGPASDVFSLGSVLTYAVRGEGPFDGGSIPSIVHRIVTGDPDLGAVPPPLRDLIAACLVKDPAARPTVADVLRALSGAADGAETWLPAPVAAMIADRDVATGPDTAPPPPAAVSPVPPPPPAALPAPYVPPAPPAPVSPAQYGQPYDPYRPAMGTPPPGYSPMPVPTAPGEYPPRPPGSDRTKLAAVGAAVAAVVILAVVGLVAVSVTCCEKDSSGTRENNAGVQAGDPYTASSTSPAQENTPAPESPQDPSEALVGTWVGTYQCTQGLTALRLTIRKAAAGEGLEATFAFSEHPSNPGVPSGSFLMRGSYVGGLLQLRGERWIDQPDGYLMVDLSAEPEGDRPARIEGDLQASSTSCTTFSVNRRS